MVHPWLCSIPIPVASASYNVYSILVMTLAVHVVVLHQVNLTDDLFFQQAVGRTNAALWKILLFSQRRAGTVQNKQRSILMNHTHTGIALSS